MNARAVLRALRFDEPDDCAFSDRLPIESWRKLPDFTDRAQWMIAANPIFQIHVTEQRSRLFVRTTHLNLPIQSIERIMSKSVPLETFSTAC